jgi:hypothetical protein
MPFVSLKISWIDLWINMVWSACENFLDPSIAISIRISDRVLTILKLYLNYSCLTWETSWSCVGKSLIMYFELFVGMDKANTRRARAAQ